MSDNVFLPALAVLLMLSSPAHSGAGAPAVSVPSNDTRDKGQEITPSPSVEDRGYIYIAVHPEAGKLEPPAEPLLTDPNGKKLGVNPRTGATYSELPPSYYDREGLGDAETGEPGPTSCVMDIANPVDGKYSLLVIGVEDGRYDLELTGSDAAFNPFHAEFLGVDIKKGETHEYSLVYFNKPGSETVVKRIK